jgi:RNA polymerase sigma-70 factor (ECF subfamily)
MREKKLLVEELLLPHLHRAYNLARWIVESDTDAQTVVEEAYTHALERFVEFRGADGGTRLVKIVRNRAYTLIGERSNSQLREGVRSDPTEEPSLAFSREGRKGVLHAALGRLPAEFREILMLCDIEGRTYAELAAILDLSTAAVTSRLNQARLLLRGEMTEIWGRRLPKRATQK